MTWPMSSRLGIRAHLPPGGACRAGGLHQLDEPVEQVGGVVRSGGGLRVVLDAEGRHVQRPHALHTAVVRAGVGDLGGAERGVEPLPRLALHGEPVVLRGDRDAPGGVLDHGDVDAAVAVAHLVGPAAQRPAEDLVAEADAEQRDPPRQHLPGELDGPVGGGRVAGAVGEEEAVGPQRQDLLDRGVRGQDVHLDTAVGEHARGVGLDADVQRGHPVARRAHGGHDVGLRGGDGAVEVGALHRRALPHAVHQFGVVGEGRAGEDPGPHGAALAQVAHQRAGVDPRHADHALGAQGVVQGAGGAPVRRRPARVAHHVPGHLDARGLVVLVVPAGVADLRRGLHHDLAVVGRVGQRLLVPGHAGGEDGLTEALPRRTVGLAAEDPSVLEDQ